MCSSSSGNLFPRCGEEYLKDLLPWVTVFIQRTCKTEANSDGSNLIGLCLCTTSFMCTGACTQIILNVASRWILSIQRVWYRNSINLFLHFDSIIQDNAKISYRFCRFYVIRSYLEMTVPNFLGKKTINPVLVRFSLKRLFSIHVLISASSMLPPRFNVMYSWVSCV